MKKIPVIVVILVLASIMFAGPSNAGTPSLARSISPLAYAANVEGKDIVRFGEDVTIDKNQTVSGSLVVFGGDATIAGTVGKDAVIFGGNARLEPTAHIKGNLVNFGGKVEKAKGARVDGDEVTGKGERAKGRWHMPSWFAQWLSWYLRSLALLGTMALSALVVALFPRQTEVLARKADEEPWKSLGIGFLAAFLTPVAVFIIILTLIGILFVPFLLIALPLIFLYAYVGAARLLGEKIVQRMRASRTSPIAETLVGVLTLGIIGFVPFIGGIVKAIALFIGLGAVILTKFGTGQPWRRHSQGQPPATPPEPPAQS